MHYAFTALPILIIVDARMNQIPNVGEFVSKYLPKQWHLKRHWLIVLLQLAQQTCNWHSQDNDGPTFKVGSKNKTCKCLISLVLLNLLLTSYSHISKSNLQEAVLKCCIHLLQFSQHPLLILCNRSVTLVWREWPNLTPACQWHMRLWRSIIVLLKYLWAPDIIQRRLTCGPLAASLLNCWVDVSSFRRKQPCNRSVNVFHVALSGIVAQILNFEPHRMLTNFTWFWPSLILTIVIWEKVVWEFVGCYCLSRASASAFFMYQSQYSARHANLIITVQLSRVVALLY